MLDLRRRPKDLSTAHHRPLCSSSEGAATECGGAASPKVAVVAVFMTMGVGAVLCVRKEGRRAGANDASWLPLLVLAEARPLLAPSAATAKVVAAASQPTAMAA